jgi:hypothetical protein
MEGVNIVYYNRGRPTYEDDGGLGSDEGSDDPLHHSLHTLPTSMALSLDALFSPVDSCSTTRQGQTQMEDPGHPVPHPNLLTSL